MIFFGSILAKNADILRHILVRRIDLYQEGLPKFQPTKGEDGCGKDATAGLKERLKACSVLRRRGGMHKMQKCERNGVCVSGLILRMLLIRGEAQV